MQMAAESTFSAPTLALIKIPYIGARISVTLSNWSDHVDEAAADDHDDMYSVESAPIEVPIVVDGVVLGISKWHIRVCPRHSHTGPGKHFVVWLHCDSFPNKEIGDPFRIEYELRLVNQIQRDGKHDFICNPKSANTVSC